VITYFVVPNIEATHRGSVIADVKSVLMNKKVVLVCLLTGLMLGPLEGFADVWGSEFLRQVYGYETHLASYLPSMIFIGMCFGGPVLSLLAEKSKRYFAVIMGAGLVMLSTFVALVAQELNVTTMSISFVGVGICSAYQILAIYKVSTFVPEHLSSISTAVANMIIMLFGYAFHTVIGFVIHSYGTATVAKAFSYGIGVIPVTLAIGVIGFMTLVRSEERTLNQRAAPMHS
jgi:MFS family permease